MSLTSYRAAPPRDAFVRFMARVASRFFGLEGFAFWVCSALRRFPRAEECDRGLFWYRYREIRLLFRFGGDLLSHVLRRSTIGVLALNGRVRDGIGCFTSTMTTKPKKKPYADVFSA